MYTTIKKLSILTSELRDRFTQLHYRVAALQAGYSNICDWTEGVSEDYGTLPTADFQRYKIYTATPETWGYAHHQNICKFQGRYYAIWSNSKRNEDALGQETHWSVSADGKNWEDGKCLASADGKEGILQATMGLYANDQMLVAYVMSSKRTKEPATPGMWADLVTQIDVFVTHDGHEWKEVKGLVSNVGGIFEGPRLTANNRLLAGGCNGFHAGLKPIALVWDDTNPISKPRVVEMPCSDPDVKPSESSWYQLNSGQIIMFFRDEGRSMYLWQYISGDGGQTWSGPIVTNFPDSMSRVNVGRFNDGRYYLINNSVRQLLNRTLLIIAISDDGLVFNKAYSLIGGPTHRRIDGMHKEDGYQYPHSLVDEDKLFVIYSVNKEDIEVGILDTNRL